MPHKFLLTVQRNLVPLCTFFISLLVTIAGWQAVNDYEQHEAEQKFSQMAGEYQRLLERRLVTYVHFLDGLGALFSVDDAVNSQTFTNYIDHINILDNYPGTKRIGYLPLVPAQLKANHEAQMRAAGFTDYKIKSGGNQAEFFPYDYLYPYDEGARQGVLGVDEHNEPVRKEALQKARDWNQVIATGKLKKVLVPSKQVSFLLYAPIYKMGAPHRTLIERRDAIRGYVYAAFRAEDLVIAAWGHEFTQIADIRFTVGNTPSSTGLLYESTHADAATRQCSQCFKYTGMFQAAGQQWLLEFHPRPAFYRLHQENLSWLVLIGGIIISLLLTIIAVLFNGKRREARLRQEQNQRFRSLFDQNPDAVYAFDLSGHFTEANGTTAALTGIAVNELIGKSYAPFIAPEYLEASQKRFAQAASGTPTYGELAILNKVGKRIEISSINLPIVTDGKVVGVFGIAKDITARKTAEAQNRQMQQFLDATLENLPTMLFVKEAKSLRFIAWNRASEELTGILREEMIGKTDYDFFNKQDADYFTATDRGILERGESMDIPEEAIQTRHQGTRWLHTRKVPFRMGDTQYLLGISEDITERRQAEAALQRAHAELEERVQQRTRALSLEIEARKKSEQALLESEEKYRSIFEQAPVGITHIDLGGKWLKTNQKFLDILEFSADELKKLTYADITHPDDLDKSFELVRRIMAHETNSDSVEKRYIRKDGNEVWVNVTWSAIFDANNNVKYFLSIVEDITQRKEAEAALRQLTRHLQTVREDERARIAREIHDELGGVLAAVKFDLSVPLRQDDLDQSGITKRNQETIKLVDNAIVALRRIMADLRPSVLDDLGLWAGLEWLATDFESRMGIQTSFRLKGEEVGIEANRATALFRMVQEALTNVAKHARATEVRISATTMASDIIIRIHDNGCGIRNEEKSKAKSFGILGMQERAQAFGGIVKINGRAGEGTTVSINFPVSDDNNAKNADRG